MILIAHRGLTNGPDVNLENRPQQIEMSLREGFHCEIDVWFKDEKWFLGHDAPDYNVDYDFLKQQNLWIHAKNLEALYVLSADRSLNFFWHQADNYTLTSQGDIWTFPGKPLTSSSIQVLPEWDDPEFKKLNFNCLGICSDYVARIKTMIPTGQIY